VYCSAMAPSLIPYRSLMANEAHSTVPSFFATMSRVQMSQLERCGLACGLGGFWNLHSCAANWGASGVTQWRNHRALTETWVGAKMTPFGFGSHYDNALHQRCSGHMG
jgi:hypothetical protein